MIRTKTRTRTSNNIRSWMSTRTSTNFTSPGPRLSQGSGAGQFFDQDSVKGQNSVLLQDKYQVLVKEQEQEQNLDHD